MANLRTLRSCAGTISIGMNARLMSGQASNKLFTPGPLTVSLTTKQAMLVDMGSRDDDFVTQVSDIRRELLHVGGTSQRDGYEAVLMQGSGTFGVESVLGSLIPAAGKLCVASNGAYGKRMVAMAGVLRIPTIEVAAPEHKAVDVEMVMETVRKDTSITHVAVVHHETTAGVLNDVPLLGSALASLDRPVSLIVDAMSSFGAYPVDVHAWRATAVVSSANKCIEGVPGFSFALVEKKALEAARGQARSLALDLYAQWAGLESTGQFRFTPPTHALMAFRQALREHAVEGGAPGRLARYTHNTEVLLSAMAGLGFLPYIKGPHRGSIITTFLVPIHTAFQFKGAYADLAREGFLIYPGKTTLADSFRIGSIGQLYPDDMLAVTSALGKILKRQGVPLPVKQIASPD